MRALYSLLLTLSLPLLVARLWWRGQRLPAYRQRIAERFGAVTRAAQQLDPAKPTLWIHAVSVGETIAATGLMEQLLATQRFNLLVTTTTPTGSERLLASFAGRVVHVYAPYDVPWLVGRFLRAMRPSAYVVMETELWPNTLAACRCAGIQVLLANARLSAKSARGYARFAGLSREIMANLSGVAAQNAVDGQRFMDLGLAPDKLQITGNIKFDASLAPATLAAAAQLKTSFNGRPVVIAGSTHEGEEAMLLSAFAQLRTALPNALLILAPRHPDRFESVAQLCIERGFTLAKRSNPLPLTPDVAILLGDTLGELTLLYGTADVAFIGGSLIQRGGHNMLEAAIWGIPVLSGPWVFNFQTIADSLAAAGGLAGVHTAEDVVSAWLELLGNPVLRAERGAKAQAYVEQNRGALERLVTMVNRLLN